MTKFVGICGGPSSGKTVLTRSLVNTLSIAGYNSDYIVEYARDYINSYLKEHGEYGIFMVDQLNIMLGQLEREDNLVKDVQYAITDCPTFICLAYTIPMTDFRNRRDMVTYLNLFKSCMINIYRYDYLFFTPFMEDSTYVADGTRIQKPNDCKDISNRIKGFLDFHNIKYINLESVPLRDRKDFCYKKIMEGENESPMATDT